MTRSFLAVIVLERFIDLSLPCFKDATEVQMCSQKETSVDLRDAKEVLNLEHELLIKTLYLYKQYQASLYQY